MNRDILADRIIHDHTVYSLAAGAIPLPIADIAAVTAVQVDLVRALARIYDVSFDPAVGKALITSVLGASAARVGASAAKAIPGVGLVPGIFTQAGFAGVSTYAIGNLFRSHFARQGTLEEFDEEESRPIYSDLVQRGKEFVRRLRPIPRRSLEDTAALIERLARLRDQNAIDEDEFRQLKRDALSSAA